ncbi:MAG: hypothetical protein ABSE73_11500 [Planctomycetota bacterium]
MNSLQKATLWVVGCLVLVFALSVALSWYQFGYLDWVTTVQMGLMLLPVLGAAAFVVLRTGKTVDREAPTNSLQQAEEPALKKMAEEVLEAAGANHERR